MPSRLSLWGCHFPATKRSSSCCTEPGSQPPPSPAQHLSERSKSRCRDDGGWVEKNKIKGGGDFFCPDWSNFYTRPPTTHREIKKKVCQILLAAALVAGQGPCALVRSPQPRYLRPVSVWDRQSVPTVALKSLLQSRPEQDLSGATCASESLAGRACSPPPARFGTWASRAATTAEPASARQLGFQSWGGSSSGEN